VSEAQVAISGERLGELLEHYLAATALSDAEDWRATLIRSRSVALTANPAPKEYWVDLYSARQETAVSMGTGLAGELSRVVDELSDFNGESLNLVMISDSGYGYFVWLDQNLSAVISCLRLRDKRVALDQS
jgi:hypothetical protein